LALVVDTGVLVAGYDRDDQDHATCSTLLAEARERRLVPAPVVVELDHLLRRLEPVGLVGFLDDVASGAFELVELVPEDRARVRELLVSYADLRVGYVDAAVLAVVERFGETKLATLDRRHFTVMRPRHVAALELLPA